MAHLIFEPAAALLSVLLPMVMGATTWASPRPNCISHCGNLTQIPYPFGIGPGCFLNDWYEIECKRQKGNVVVPFLKKINSEVLTITLCDPEYLTSYFKVMLPTVWNRTNSEFVGLEGSLFFFSSFYNRFTAIGCNTTAMLENRKTGEFRGCKSTCQVADDDTDFITKSSRSIYGNCSSGMNRCETPIPSRAQDLSVRIMKEEKDTSPSGYAFMFNDSRSGSDLLDITKLNKIPVVLDWGVAKDLSITNDNNTSNSHFYCYELSYDSSDDEQYQQNQTGLVVCYCRDGYEGNPYSEKGCTDIDECKDGQHNCHAGTCVNRPGYYDCVVNRKMRFVVIALVPIYHRDIKSGNILLDGKYRAKLADFGIARLVSLEQTHLTTLVQGTFGYFDPEYFQSSQYTDKSDVYSFGVVLVELLTGQKPISSLREREGRSLATYFAHSIEDNLLFGIIDPYILNQVQEEEICKVGNLAYRCLDLNGSKRPTMKDVKMELEVIKRLKDLSVDDEIEEKFIDEAMEPFDVDSSPSSCGEDVDQSSEASWMY